MLIKTGEIGLQKGSVAVSDGSGFKALTPTTDTYVLQLDSTQPLGVKWGVAGSGSGDLTATYITQTADASLPNSQALGALAGGIMKCAATTGVVSIATAGTDYLTTVVTANITASNV